MKKIYCIALLFVMLLLVGCSASEAEQEAGVATEPETASSPVPSENVPPSKLHLSFTSYDEGTFKLKATNESEDIVALKDIELEAYDVYGMPLDVTVTKRSPGKLQPGDESGLYVYEISPAGAETRIVIDDYTYKRVGQLYEGHIYYEGYETADGWASHQH